MKRLTLLFVVHLASVLYLDAQHREPGMHLPQPTPDGIGKIDTRIDNMRYWRKMADSGYVYVAPVISIPEAVYTGSGIGNRSVLFTNSPDVLTTSLNSTQSENSVFVDPNDNNTLINSNNSTENPVGDLYGANSLLSSDGGQTWGGSIEGAGGYNSGDPTTAISLGGRYFVGYIDDALGQSVSFSSNNGMTWTPVVSGIVPAGYNNMLDKNHMWIDNSPASPYQGNLYNAWTCFGGDNDAEIEITRSSDGGLTWSQQTAISTALNAGSHNQGVNIQTGPNGEVYVAWAVYDIWPEDENAIGFVKSTDGGASFTAATRIISNIRGIRITETGKNHRVNSFPSMAVDISGGPNNGNIYIVWANVGVPGVNSGNDIDVYMIRSIDNGVNWSAPVKINQDASGLGKQHYFPWITCDPLTGELSVVFYDDRNVSSTQCEVFAASSSDGGQSWTDFKVSDVSFTPSPIPGLAGGYMGDYLGISALGGKVYPVWPDNRTGTIMTYVSPFVISANPYARFSASSSTPCLNDTVILTDQSFNDPLTWQWTITPSTFNYVNGTSAVSQNPQVVFTAFGNYDVQLTITNAQGSNTLTRTGCISVNEANPDFTASNAQVVIDSPVTFTDASSCNITSYAWDFGSDATPANANTQGPHQVTYSSSGFKTISLTVNGTVTETKNDFIQVVPLTYCAAGANTCDEHLSRVQFNTIDNVSGCSSGGYTDFTAVSTRLSPGQPYSMTVTNGKPYTQNQCGIWIDWNRNGVLTDAGEIMTVSGTPGTGPYTASITPPANAPKGFTRMRIRITYTGSVSACGNATWGEVEDYTVYVGTPGLWTGGSAGAENDWDNAANWDDGRVPDPATNVVIPDGVAHYPEVSGTYQCLNMEVKDGAIIQVATGSTLNVLGDLVIGQGFSGTLIIDGGTCNVAGEILVGPGGVIDLTGGGTLNDID